jgi:hypothetical protein
MTDFERYKYILDTTGVKYEECLYPRGMDLEIKTESMAAFNKPITIVFEKDGSFSYFETNE